MKKNESRPATSTGDQHHEAQSNQALSTENSRPAQQVASTTKPGTQDAETQLVDSLLAERSARRRQRLELLIEQRAGGIAKDFADLAGYSPMQISQFLSLAYRNGRSLGERAARTIECRLGLPSGWLDGDAPNFGGVATRTSALSAACASPALYPLEVYAGVVQHHGVPTHLILLPGDVQVTGLDVAKEFVASVGGEFPSYAELKHLRKLMPHRFKPDLYYTCDEEPYDDDMGTLLFDFATDADRVAQKGPRRVRARAVRRVPAQAGRVGELTEERVATIARDLIDQESPGDESDVTNEELMISAGMKLGIGKMAMAVQQALAAHKRQHGGDHA